MKIKLDTGREITLARIEQWRTYAGMLAGIPQREWNRRLIEDVCSKASQHCMAGASPYLGPPQTVSILPRVASESTLKAMGMTDEQFIKNEQKKKYERLPAVVCVAGFDSGALEKTDSEPFSSLTVVWFQDDFALPMDAGVLAHIQSLDWEKLATDWCW